MSQSDGGKRRNGDVKEGERREIPRTEWRGNRVAAIAFRSAQMRINSTATLASLGPATDLLPSQEQRSKCGTVAPPSVKTVHTSFVCDWPLTHTEGPLLCMHGRNTAP